MVPFWGVSQVTDNFSDGNITQDPAWSGDLAHFKVSSSTAVPEEMRPALQLYAPSAGQSCLAVACSLTGDMEWQFWIKLSLNTSSGNFARVYLMASTDSLKAPVDGYFLQFGGATDSVDFYRQDSLEATHLFRLDGLFTGNSTNALRLRVIRTGQGNWAFFGDPAGTNLLQPVGETSDWVCTQGGYAGIFFQYTGSNTSKFYFDDLYAGPLIVDTLAPEIVGVTVVNPAEIEIVFNEPVEPESAENESNYSISPGIGAPYSAIRLLDPSMVRLFFDRDLTGGIIYSLEIRDIADLSGNIAGLLTSGVMFYQASPFDIIFSEIMADPTPSAGLPEFEYLEIYNRSGAVIDLGGWVLEIGSSVHELPRIGILPSEHFILCGDDAVGAFQGYGRAIGFGSFGLSNSGTSVGLSDASGKSICFLNYDPGWLGDGIQSEGGYSLEITDPGNPCVDIGNWRASGHPDGGTPGRVNFNAGSILEEVRVEGVCCIHEKLLQVTFDAAMDSLGSSDATNYEISPGGFYPDSAVPLPPDYRLINLYLNEPVTPGVIYTLNVRGSTRNCLGEDIGQVPGVDFAWPETCAPFDIVINEILFNPVGEGVDYVEIFNRSDKAILLSEMNLVSVRESPPNPPDTQYCRVTDACRSILPGQYLALTRDPEMVRSQYYAQDPEAFLKMTSFPLFSNDEGYVMLFMDGMIIDGFHYREEMHFIMLNSAEGVALERISPDRLGDDPGNWHSAAETVGFGTPGYENSQHLEHWLGETRFSLSNSLFSPDGDGRDDQLGIAYQISEPGTLVSILVFSAGGMLTKTLVNNQMPGTSGIFSWDGTMDDRTPAGDGIYVIYTEELDMNGRMTRQKLACVLARSR